MTQPQTSTDIQEWLTDRLSKALSVPKGVLDPDAPFSQYALDSLDAVALASDIEEHLGLDLPATVLWDYPTVHKCVSYLDATLRGVPPPAAAG